MYHIYDFKGNTLWVTLFMNELELTCLHHLSGFNYCYLTLRILFNLKHLFV